MYSSLKYQTEDAVISSLYAQDIDDCNKNGYSWGETQPCLGSYQRRSDGPYNDE